MSNDNSMDQATLRVQEGLPEDARKGIARIDVAHLDLLGLKLGEYVEITGKRATAARVVPAFGDVYGYGVIQIDGVTRENCGAGIGDRVKVRRVHPKPAQFVVLSPAVAPEFDSR